MEAMIPIERLGAVRQKKKPDKLPLAVGPTNEFLSQYYDISTNEYLTDADFCVDCHLKLIEEFQVDSIVIAPGYILYGCGPELGVHWQFTEDEHFPGFKEGPLKTEKDLEAIAVPARPQGYFEYYLKVLKKAAAKNRRGTAMVGHILGTFSIGCFLRGIETALMDTAMKPEFFRTYMKRCVELSTFFGRNVLDTGINAPIMNEIFLTPQMMGPASYRKMIEPCNQQVLENLGIPPHFFVLGGEFIGYAGDKHSQREGLLRYKAMFGLLESFKEIREACDILLPHSPFPITLSGSMIDKWNSDKIVGFLSQSVDYFVKVKDTYPVIGIASVLAHSKNDAKEKAEKLAAIRNFRDSYAF